MTTQVSIFTAIRSVYYQDLIQVYLKLSIAAEVQMQQWYSQSAIPSKSRYIRTWTATEAQEEFILFLPTSSINRNVTSPNSTKKKFNANI